jgi:hypothetical protein
MFLPQQQDWGWGHWNSPRACMPVDAFNHKTRSTNSGITNTIVQKKNQ